MYDSIFQFLSVRLKENASGTNVVAATVFQFLSVRLKAVRLKCKSS